MRDQVVSQGWLVLHNVLELVIIAILGAFNAQLAKHRTKMEKHAVDVQQAAVQQATHVERNTYDLADIDRRLKTLESIYQEIAPVLMQNGHAAP